jgi:hypothetical protein
MIKNFTEVKSQLEELAPVINSFQSEAVQLKIIELIFSGEIQKHTSQLGEEEMPAALIPEKKRSRKKKSPDKESTQKRVPKQVGRPGPGAIIDRLITDGLFNEKKLISDIIHHCKINLAYTYKATELSTALGRAIRSGKLKREKNQEGQFEYTKT